MKEIIREKNKQLRLEKQAKTGINPKYYGKIINAKFITEQGEK